MPIAAVTPGISATLSSLAGGQDKNTPAAAGAADTARSSPAVAPANDTDRQVAATVSLSPAASAAGQANARPVLSPVYAEIWRDGVRIAQVDIHGQVTSSEGLVATTGSGLAGPLLAAQRAVQAARQLGGEIRTAGQPVDSQTLLMRERLASTYTA